MHQPNEVEQNLIDMVGRPVLVQQPNPEAMVRALRELADELESGRWQVKSGDLMLDRDHAVPWEPGSLDTLKVRGSLVLVPSFKIIKRA